MSRFWDNSNENNGMFEQLNAQAKLLEELRKFRHDYKNQLWGLQVLLDKGEYGRAKAYLSEITDRMNGILSNKCSYSDNYLADAVLQNLAVHCEKEGICFAATVILAEDFPLSDVELCSVFSNMADNALEAVLRQNTDDDKRFITFSTSRRAKWLTVSAENSYSGVLEVAENGDFITQKRDESNHGIGIKSIISIVESKGGSVRIDTEDDGIFRISLIFPIK